LDFARNQAARLDATGVEFVCYSGGQTPFAQETFDTVVCVDVIEHLPKPEEFLREFLRVLKPGGHLLLSFGPPWGHAHGKHMWARLPGWWTHLLFPRRVVMRTLGYAEATTWEDLGLHRLTVAKYGRAIRASGFETLYERRLVNSLLRWAKYAPLLRELVIGEVVGVYRKPA
jgi:SAM-dependent methyltransferase